MKRKPIVIDNGEYIPYPGAQSRLYAGSTGGGGGGKRAMMEAYLRAYTTQNPNATVAVLSIDPAKCRIEKPAGSGKA